MRKRVLFVIDTSRPEEAVRIAAGIAVWKQVEVSLHFRGPAATALTAEDDDSLARHLAIFREAGGRIAADDTEAARWAAEQTTVAHF